MGFFNFLERLSNKKQAQKIDLVTQNYNGTYTWGGEVYNHDLVRACVQAKAERFSKLELRHIQETTSEAGETEIKVNPWAYMRNLLTNPNPHMTLKDMLHKICVQTDLSGNAFLLIIRDDNGNGRELYPIPAKNCYLRYDSQGNLYYQFLLDNGDKWEFYSGDVIHLRDGYYENEIFGSGKFQALSRLIEVSETIDKGIINAIKNSNVIKWLLTYTSSVRPEDIKKGAQDFADNYLDISRGKSIGVAAVDSKATATQVTPQDFVPNAAQMDKTQKRILFLFGTNEKIITSTANEDEENAYYEAKIEPLAIAFKQELTLKLFTPRERGCGNYISVSAFNLQSASINTKLGLQAMVDRGALTPNEWRSAFGLTPVEGGNNPLRRLDTQPVTGGETE